jgi:hypothetical protein
MQIIEDVKIVASNFVNTSLPEVKQTDTSMK